MRLLLAFLFLGFFPAASFAQVISSTDLIEHAKDYDGKTVVYEGEVIGDIMNRDNFVWLNVNDGVNAIGIWSGKQICQDVTLAGNYRAKGDRIKVTGLFRRSCPEHGGDLDIHAESIRKVSDGKPLKESIDPDKIKAFFSLLGILCLILLLSRLKLNSKPS